MPTNYVSVITDKGLPASFPAGQALPFGYKLANQPPATPVIPPIQTVPPVKPILPTADITKTALPLSEEQLKKQIADIQAKLAELTPQYEKEKQIQGAVEKTAAIGGKYPTEAVAGMTAPIQNEGQIRQELYDKYNISGYEEAFKTRPTQTFEDIYQNIYDKLGLVNLKADIDETRKKIDKADADYNESVGNINENPWLSEASRVGRVSRLNDKYERTRSRLDNQMKLLDTQYSRGQQESENVATRALNTFNQEREYAKEELDYYVKRAEADVGARVKAGETEAKKEQFRYYPEYLSKYQKQTKAKTPSYTETQTELEKIRLKEASDYFRDWKEQKKSEPGWDGYVDPKDYQEMKEYFATQIGSTAKFDSTFASLLSPQQRDRLGVGKESYTAPKKTNITNPFE